MSEINWNKLDEMYSRSKAPENLEAVKIPSGKYTVSIQTVSFRISAQGNPYMFWVFEILEGAYQGRHLTKQNMLMTEQNMGFFKKDIAACGIKPPDALAIFSDGDKRNAFLMSLLARHMVVALKVKNGHDNVYIEQYLAFGNGDANVTPIAPEPAAVPQAAIARDEIPF